MCVVFVRVGASTKGISMTAIKLSMSFFCQPKMQTKLFAVPICLIAKQIYCRFSLSFRAFTKANYSLLSSPIRMHGVYTYRRTYKCARLYCSFRLETFQLEKIMTACTIYTMENDDFVFLFLLFFVRMMNLYKENEHSACVHTHTHMNTLYKRKRPLATILIMCLKSSYVNAYVTYYN